MNTSIIKMSNAYSVMSPDDGAQKVYEVNFSAISGTRCYLEDDAKALISHGIAGTPIDGVHFIDSGNYHYLSLLYIARIKSDFELLLIDNHPDMKAPSFGQITSCGGWVLEAIENLPNLQKVYMLGVKAELLDELMPLPDKVQVINSVDEINSNNAIYISIDKDALMKEYAVTDWDQGDMTLDELCANLDIIVKRHRIIGVDICGDTSEPDDFSDSINSATNRRLIDCLTPVL